MLPGKLFQREGKNQEVWLTLRWDSVFPPKRRKLMTMEAVGPMEGPTASGSPAGAECRGCMAALPLGTQTRPRLSALLNESHCRKARSRHKNDLSCSALMLNHFYTLWFSVVILFGICLIAGLLRAGGQIQTLSNKQKNVKGKVRASQILLFSWEVRCDKEERQLEIARDVLKEALWIIVLLLLFPSIWFYPLHNKKPRWLLYCLGFCACPSHLECQHTAGLQNKSDFGQSWLWPIWISC